MKFSALPALAALSCLSSGISAVPDEAAKLSSVLGRAASNVLANLQAEEEALAKRGEEAPSCNSRTIAIRKEFGNLSPWERKHYTDAVLCLQKKAALTPTSFGWGTKSRVSCFHSITAHLSLS